jgi:N4-gp56 family major capsid protein
MVTAYGDISPRTAAFAARDMLERALPFLVLEKFGQAVKLDSNKSKVITFRRYNALSATPNPLTEGVTPSSKQLTKTDVSATLVQYGDRIELSDVVLDTHEDPVLKEATDVLGEQAGIMIEAVRFNVLKAGTAVEYANGATRGAVNTPISLTMQRRITRTLKRQNAKPITRVVRSTPSYGSAAIAPSYIAVCHPDVENDIRGMTGFRPSEEYGTVTPWENELGKVESCRYMSSTVFEPWLNAGGTKGSMLGSGTQADVYPVLYFGRDAYGIVALKGEYAVTPMIVNPKPSDSDPLAQRGHAGWKTMQTAVILNDAWMVRGEVAVTA